MIYKGYVLDQAEVYDKERGWHLYGVVSNVLVDFTCTGNTQEELESNFKKMVDENFDDLQSLTDEVNIDLDTDVIERIMALDEYQGLSKDEIISRFMMQTLIHADLTTNENIIQNAL